MKSFFFSLFQINQHTKWSAFQQERKDVTLISPPMVHHLAELTCSWMLTLFPRPVKTSEPCVLERRDTDTRDLPSIVSFHSSCARVVTSPDKTEPEVRVFTARSLLMRTSA